MLWLSEHRDVPAFAGAETHLLTLLPALARAGVDVELFAIVLNDGEQIRQRLNWLELQGVRVTRIPILIRHRYKRGDPRLLFYFGLIVREFARRRDRILHLHLDWFFAPAAVVIAGCRRVVMSVHVDDPAWLRASWRLWIARVDASIVRYICITDRVVDHITQIIPQSTDRVRRIYYGVDSPLGGLTREEMRRKLNLPVDAFVVGFVGRLAAQKNIPALLDAAERRPDVQFVLIGEGAERRAIEKRATSLPNVRLFGYRPDAPECMVAFDALCLPSYFEGLGLVLLEAMLRGTLTIGSDAGAIPEILGSGRYGVIFKRTDSHGLESAIDWVDTHRDEAQALAAAGLRHARETFSVDAMVNHTLRVYEEVTAVR